MSSPETTEWCCACGRRYLATRYSCDVCEKDRPETTVPRDGDWKPEHYAALARIQRDNCCGDVVCVYDVQLWRRRLAAALKEARDGNHP
jgi:hypothetical protein